MQRRNGTKRNKSNIKEEENSAKKNKYDSAEDDYKTMMRSNRKQEGSDGGSWCRILSQPETSLKAEQREVKECKAGKIILS